MEAISESIVKKTAEICGPNTAAARALEDAEKRRARGEIVYFFRHDGRIIVVGHATKET